MGVTSIEWSEQSWNPIAGCNDKSPGCMNCYARTMAKRLEAMGSAKYAGLTVLQVSKTVWTGKITFDEKALLAPLSRKKPTRYFVNSMSDLFHPNVADDMVDQIFAVMALCPQHTFLVLTKRPDRMRDYFRKVSEEKDIQRWINAAYDAIPHLSPCAAGMMEDLVYPLTNVWLGTSTENQETANERIPFLLQTPAAVRFESVEPQIGDLDLTKIVLAPAQFPERGQPPVSFNALMGWNGGANRPDRVRLDWVIVGGESKNGPGAVRPFHVEWARKIVKECQAAGIPVFVKQMGFDVRTTGITGPGEHWPTGTKLIDTGQGHWKVKLKSKKGGDMSEWPEDLRVRQMPEAS